ncbi:MAG: DUF1127 domain-containing protein [Acetobacteraceae bacterium]|nr:DUF1127 domain-containing protein [Acetobacteraceae bacterium]
MSAHLSHAPSSRFTIGRPLMASARLAWQRFAHAYALALRAEASRHNLGRLDDRMLSDIGISRAQADFEAGRKPWHRA